MYCPRCNLHSEEYVDKCPLCAGAMEVDEVESGFMKTPAVPEGEKTEAFLKEESLDSDEMDCAEGVDENAISELELEQKKIIEKATQQIPDEEPAEEKTVPPLPDEKDPSDQKDHLYEQEIFQKPDEKKFSPLSYGVGIVLILMLIGAGYFYFYRSGETSFPKEIKVSLNKQERTSPQSVVSLPQVAEEQKRPSETTIAQPDAVPLSPDSETIEEVVSAKTESEKPDVIKPAAPEPVVISTPQESSVARPEPQKKEVSPVASTPAKPRDKSETAKVSKSPKELSSSSSASAGKYSLMVGAFKVKQNASDLQNRLQKKGYPVQSYLIELPGKGSWHRVVVGNYAGLKETKTVASKLKNEEKISALIMKDGKFF